MVFQYDPWILLGGIAHHKPTPQNMCLPSADRNSRPSVLSEGYLEPIRLQLLNSLFIMSYKAKEYVIYILVHIHDIRVVY